jgi:hypothetical protein
VGATTEGDENVNRGNERITKTLRRATSGKPTPHRKRRSFPVPLNSPNFGGIKTVNRGIRVADESNETRNMHLLSRRDDLPDTRIDIFNSVRDVE